VYHFCICFAVDLLILKDLVVMHDYVADRVHHTMPLHVDVVALGVFIRACGEVHR